MGCTLILANLCIIISSITLEIRLPYYLPTWGVVQKHAITGKELSVFNPTELKKLRGRIDSLSERPIRIPVFPHLNPSNGLVISIYDRRLYATIEGKSDSFPISIGLPSHPTPVGVYPIVRKASDPVWYPPPSAILHNDKLPHSIPPGPDNPMGAAALYLSLPRYAIHGTNDEYSIGDVNTLGCIRLRNSDATYLLKNVPLGELVHITDDLVLSWTHDEQHFARIATFASFEEALGTPVTVFGETFKLGEIQEVMHLSELEMRSALFVFKRPVPKG
ncbi:L,D-transpeptidase [Sinorhizobium medicae]